MFCMIKSREKRGYILNLDIALALMKNNSSNYFKNKKTMRTVNVSHHTIILGMIMITIG